ncbi:Protein high chlorophyll fluorescent 107 [Camellia lanceoleosa]|uniref:Protein high chlorophyll fluorescent 107 n=1 Tax=Camellia lanceoleosa TaxID=1840588 RepID=A0ACC0HGX1_9ERIC|nr:Protein high chlorophyll fluorescent 107 [Camellia lanceoleosa]
MEWKEGNISIAKELYQKALSINSTTESDARCLQASFEEDQGNSVRAEEIRNLYFQQVNDTSRDIAGANDTGEESASPSSEYNNAESTESSFDLDAFILERLSLDPSKLDILLERTSQNPVQKKTSLKSTGMKITIHIHTIISRDSLAEHPGQQVLTVLVIAGG